MSVSVRYFPVFHTLFIYSQAMALGNTQAPQRGLPMLRQRAVVYRCWDTDLLNCRILAILSVLVVGLWVVSSIPYLVTEGQRAIYPTGPLPQPPRHRYWSSRSVGTPVENTGRAGEGRASDSSGSPGDRQYLSKFDHQADSRFALGVARRRPVEEVLAPYYKAWEENNSTQS